MVQEQNADRRIECFDSTRWEQDADLQNAVRGHLDADEIKQALVVAFGLSPDDSFEYWAHMPITLSEMQRLVNLGDVNGLHHWYSTGSSTRKVDSSEAPQGGHDQYDKPSKRDVDAYVSVFDPSTYPDSKLRALEEEAKAKSIARQVGSYLRSKRHVHESLPKVPRRKQPHWNPGLVFWAWYCRNCAWAGPMELTQLRSVNHPVLPIMMHHFGCVVPSWESLEIMRFVTSDGEKPIHEIGSGNGYWAYMLHRHGLDVRAVDNGQSIFRTTWIADTINASALAYLARENGAKEGVLLMVYPVVSGDFTKSVLEAYRGDVIAVAGTQNGNGYTGFKNMTIDQWMALERPGWTKLAQLPLPSFPGKDEALFIFCRHATRAIVTGDIAKISDTKSVQPLGRNAKANARKKAKRKQQAEANAAVQIA